MGDASHPVPALPVRANGSGEQRTANDLIQLLRDWLVGMKSTSSQPGEKSSVHPPDTADDGQEAARFVR
jgi:hypothetical protein